MIEERLREAFARRESVVPNAARLVPLIDAEARRRRGLRRLMRSTAVAMALIVAVGGAPILGRALLGGGHARPHSAGLPAEAPLNFLIAGLDRLPAWPSGTPTHADAIIVAHVPADRGAVYLMTIPRDLEVDIPPYAAKDFAGDRTRISYAYAFGGFPLLAQTVTGLTGLSFDGGAIVELAGLADLVDELGGVPVCVSERAKSIHTRQTFAPGCRRMTGAEARDFLRQRKDYHDGAVARAWYVTRFLGAVLRRLASPDTLASLDRLRAVVDTVRRHVVVDTRGRDPVQLAWDLRSAVGTVVEVSVPTRAVVPDPPGHLGYLRPTGDARALFDALRRDTMEAWVAANPDHGERVEW
jgi:LCP family protein required for cell wall assembly